MWRARLGPFSSRPPGGGAPPFGRLISPDQSRGKAPARDLCARFGRLRPPDQEPPLDQRDDKVDADHKRGEYEHAGEHAGDVEHAFGLLDDVAESGSRAEILAD